MTYQDREEIFSKEALSIGDVARIYDCSCGKASEMIRQWKSRLTIGMGKTLHLDFDGKIHILGYFEIMGINPNNPGDRYSRRRTDYSVYDELAACGADTRKKIYGYS